LVWVGKYGRFFNVWQSIDHFKPFDYKKENSFDTELYESTKKSINEIIYKIWHLFCLPIPKYRLIMGNDN
jgi:hypothetical protein